MQRILFVCTGNTCRSPMAEAILKAKNLPDVEVKSAGIYAVNGSDASPHARQILTQNHIPHDHKSALLSEKEVNWATVILTMTASHKQAILMNYPETRGKIFTLKEYAGETEDLDVMDPFGGDVETYRHTYAQLVKLIDQAINQFGVDRN